MSRVCLPPVTALMLGAAGLVGPVPVAAHAPQQGQLVGRVEIREAPSGWVGVEFRKRVADDTARVMVSSVFPGSPADRAGLRAGDRVLKVNGTPVTFAIMESVGPRIQPGDPWTFTILRGGDILEIPLTAVKRPESAEIIVTRMQVQLDTMHKLMGLTLDSLRRAGARAGDAPLPTLEVRPIDERDGAVTVVVASADGTFTVSDARLRAVEPTPPPRSVEVRMRGGEARLRAENVAWADGDHFATAWIRRDSTRVASSLPPAPPAVRPATPDDYVRIEARARSQAEGTPPGDGWTVAGSLSPWAEGARRVAGAEMHPVGEDLGRYLGVRRGLLIVDVTPGTPAARSGLLPGDVVLAADDTPLESLADLREVLTIPATTNLLLVHRRGSVMEFDLRR